MMLCILWYLNPHSHKGSDQVKRHISKTLSYFNPHSHKGSDLSYQAWYSSALHFNPHSHKGSDYLSFNNFPIISEFQSTFPQREWLSTIPIAADITANFNPHSHEGSDFLAMTTSKSYPLFQSTLPRREWLDKITNRILADIISIHTPTKGVTRGNA